ncbi:MAG TPA: FAD-dependent thymidylate synthase [bacterium]|jgi:thymidylate synthase (FAD)
MTPNMVEIENTSRADCTSLNGLLGVPLKVLDDGFIRVIDYMGSDHAIVQAARVSYGQGTKQIHEDRGLIRYLMRHRHTTPFEMCEIKLHIRVPMDTWRQWIRHRTANVNEYSTRYSIAIDSAHQTKPDQWRLQTSDNRQGSKGKLTDTIGQTLTNDEVLLHQHCRQIYDARIQAGVTREQARKDLPLSTYTEAYWKIDLHNLLHFLHLRMDSHAQIEIRQYADIIGNEIVSRWCPLTWEAFLDYRLNAMILASPMIELIRATVQGRIDNAMEIAVAQGWIAAAGANAKVSRERQEAEDILERLGILPPWRNSHL